MKFLGNLKYIIAAVAVGLILLWICYHWGGSNNYVESEYFFNYFPFADKSSVIEDADFHEKKLELKELDVMGEKAPVIRLPLNCRLDYYLRIPRDASLKIFLKHYGSKRLHTVEQVKISIQEENKPSLLLHSIKFPKGVIKNDWRTEHISLDRYSDKIVKLTFSVVQYGGISKQSEGYLISPFLMINKELLKIQRDVATPEVLEIGTDKLKRTNVIIIILDAARPDHFGCYGYHRRTTPHIDRLAKESVIFKNAFSVAPYTLASTTSLFTSLYPNTHRVVRWEQKIPHGIVTLPEICAQQGYATYASGFILKWARKSFQEAFKLSFSSEEDFANCLNYFLQNMFANKKQKLPSFIYIHLDPPHSDYSPPERFDKWSAKDKRVKYAELIRSRTLYSISQGEKSIGQEELQFIIDKYDGNLLWADWLVHLILEGFKKLGLYDDSLIMVASDHGEAFMEHGKMMHNCTVYDEMIKIPLIIKFPSYIKPKKKIVTAYVENIDIMPTILEFLQIKYANLNLQGKSLLPLIFSDVNQVKPYLFARAVAINNRVFSLSDSQYKYIHMHDQEELYNLQSDPQEKINLASSKPILYGYYKSLAYFYLQQQREVKFEKPLKAKLDEETITKLRSLGYLQ